MLAEIRTSDLPSMSLRGELAFQPSPTGCRPALRSIQLDIRRVLALSLFMAGIAAHHVDNALAAYHFAVFANPLHAGTDFHLDLPSFANWRGKAPQYKQCHANLPRAQRLGFRLQRQPDNATEPEYYLALIFLDTPKSPCNHPLWRGVPVDSEQTLFVRYRGRCQGHWP